MTTDHDDDADLAPVTDLFGARSRRRRATASDTATDPNGPDGSNGSRADAEPTAVVPAVRRLGSVRRDGALTDQGDAGPRQAGPRQSGPRDADTNHIGPAAGDPGHTGLDGVDPGRAGPDAWDPGRTAPGTADPDAADHDPSDSDPFDAGADELPDADTPVPLPIRGARAQADWLSPVVGDGSGRSARAEQGGYDEDSAADASTASVFAIGSGIEIDPADAPRPIDEQRADAERLSMRALGRRGVSESELRTMLAQNDLDADVVEYEIERLTRVGLLDDVALATDLVDRLHDRKGLGRQGVVAELRRRGIDQAAIDAALDAAADDEDDEFVRAIDLAQKRAGQLRGLDRATAERRLSGYLMRKGYNGGVVRIAVERALSGGGRPGGGPRGPVRFE